MYKTPRVLESTRRVPYNVLESGAVNPQTVILTHAGDSMDAVLTEARRLTATEGFEREDVYLEIRAVAIMKPSNVVPLKKKE